MSELPLPKWIISSAVITSVPSQAFKYTGQRQEVVGLKLAILACKLN